MRMINCNTDRDQTAHIIMRERPKRWSSLWLCWFLVGYFCNWLVVLSLQCGFWLREYSQQQQHITTVFDYNSTHTRARNAHTRKETKAQRRCVRALRYMDLYIYICIIVYTAIPTGIDDSDSADACVRVWCENGCGGVALRLFYIAHI